MKVTTARLFCVAGAVIVLSLFSSAQRTIIPETTQLGNLKIHSIQAPSAIEAQIAKKRPFNLDLIQRSLTYRDLLPVLKLKDGKQVALIPVDEKAVLPEGLPAQNLYYLPNAYRNYNPNAGLSTKATSFIWAMQHVDHRSCQTPIRDQGSRGTCTAFASVAGIEAWESCHTTKSLNLSEQDAYEWTLKEVNGTCASDPGTATYNTAKYLTDHHICLESDWAYQSTTTGCSDTRPAQCSNDENWGFTTTQLIMGTAFGGTSGQSANDPSFLENFLYNGYDIVYGLYVAGTEWNDGTAESGVVDVQQQNGKPAPAYAGHAMLMVGYNSVDKYFIFKNSWGTGHGHSGYFYVSYDYITTYGKYGYAVQGIADVQCAHGMTSCAGKCVNPLNDKNNCGGCGKKCTGADMCIDGSCEHHCPPPNQVCQCGHSWHCAKTCSPCP